MKTELIKEKITSIIKIVVLALILSLGAGFALSWSEPTDPPPAGNAAAPVNVGSTPQVKTGDLAVEAFLASLNAAFEGSVEIDGRLTIGEGFPEPGNYLLSNDSNGLSVWVKPGGFSSFIAGGEVEMTPSSTVYLSTEGVEHSGSFGVVMDQSGSIISVSGSSDVSGFDNRGLPTDLVYRAGVVGGGYLTASVPVENDGAISATGNEDRGVVTFEAGDMIFVRQSSSEQTYTTNSIVKVRVHYDDTIDGQRVNKYPIPPDEEEEG